MKMTLSEFRGLIKNILKEVYKENNELSNENIKNILIRRIPFLNDYDIYEDDINTLEAKRVTFHENVKLKIGNQFMNFEQLNVSSEIKYFPQIINDNTFHIFSIKNSLHPSQPKEMDDLTYNIFLLALKQIESQNSYFNELIVRNGKNISEEDLNKILNEMNRVLFKFEDYTKRMHIDLF